LGSAVIRGWLSWRRKTKPLWQANGPDPQSRLSPTEASPASDAGPSPFLKAWSRACAAAAGLPAESAASKGSNVAAVAGLLKLPPPSVETTYWIEVS